MCHRRRAVCPADDRGRDGALACAEQPVGDIACKGKTGDDDDHQPQGLRLPGIIGTETALGQEGEDGECDDRIAGESLDIGCIERADPAMDFGSQGKNRGNDCASCHSQRRFAGSGKKAEAERDHGSHRRGRVGLSVRKAGARVPDGDDGRRARQHDTPANGLTGCCEQAGKTSGQCKQSEGADAGNALTIFGLAQLPAALDSDEQADGQRRAQCKGFVPPAQACPIPSTSGKSAAVRNVSAGASVQAAWLRRRHPVCRA